MKEKVIGFFENIFGYGILVALFGGGLSFFGFLAALIIGGPTAEAISTFVYKQYLPIMIYISTSMILLGLVIMYLKKDHALTSSKKQKKKNEA